MKKVSLAALVAALTSTAAIADSVPANCPKAFQGFHLGGNVGVGLLYTKLTATTNNGSHRNNLGGIGFDGGLNTGYTHRWGNFLGGLEFVANWTNVKGTHRGSFNGNTFSTRAKLLNSLQGRVNFSYVIANLVAPKLILGYDASKYNIRASGNNFSASKSKYLSGFIVGGGVDFLATKHFILGVDYTYSFFGSEKSRRNTNTGVSLKPQAYGKVSLIAKFIY